MYKNQSSVPINRPLTYGSILKCRASRENSSESPQQTLHSPLRFRQLPAIPSAHSNSNFEIENEENDYVQALPPSPSPQRFVKTNMFIPFAIRNNQNNVIDELRFHQLRRQLRVSPTPKPNAPLPSRKIYSSSAQEELDSSIALNKSAIKNPYENRIQELGLQAEELRGKIAAAISELEQLEQAGKSLAEKSASAAHGHVYFRIGDSDSESDSSNGSSNSKKVHFAPEVNNNNSKNRTDDDKKEKSVLGKRWKELKIVVKDFFAKKK